MRLKISLSYDRVLLTIAVALIPLYVFPSGGLQPSHLTFLLLSMLMIARHGLPRQKWLLLLVLLAAYSLLIESIAGIFANDLHHLINSAFFLFNAVLMVGVYWVVLRHGASALTVGLFIAIIIALTSLQKSGVDLREMGEGGRMTGTFNNPNQLGYFSVCILSLTYLLFLEKEIRFSTMLGLLAASIFISITSLSKAAMLANFAVLAFTLRPGSSRYAMAMWIVLAVGGIGSVIYLIANGSLSEFLFFDRIANMAQEDDSSLTARGYYAFIDGNFLQIIFGLGGPEVHRIVGHEVHSTFGSIWNTYGLFGFSIFFPIFVIWSKTIFRAYGLTGMIVLVGPSVLYGITHNGVRFSIFWLLLASSMALAHRDGFRLCSNKTLYRKF